MIKIGQEKSIEIKSLKFIQHQIPIKIENKNKEKQVFNIIINYREEINKDSSKSNYLKTVETIGIEEGNGVCNIEDIGDEIQYLLGDFHVLTDEEYQEIDNAVIKFINDNHIIED